MGLPGATPPLLAPSCSHAAPGNTDAVQLTEPTPDAASWNEPFGLPGAAPAVIRNCAPPGVRLNSPGETRKVTGMAALPPELATVSTVV